MYAKEIGFVEGESIAGSKAHIIGMGNIGQSIAKRLAAFNVSVSGSDPQFIDFSSEFHCVDLKTGIADADWVFVACALTTDNIHLVDDELMSAMKVGARIINVARGPLIKESSLVKHLSTGHLQGLVWTFLKRNHFHPKTPLPNCQMSYLGVTVAQALNKPFIASML